MTANLFDSEPDFGREGMSARVVGQHAGSELLGATLYELAPGGRRGAHRLENESDRLARVLIVSTELMPEVVEYPERDKGGGVFVMTEPPYTGAPYDEARGRVLRLFWRDDGLPIPADEPAE